MQTMYEKNKYIEGTVVIRITKYFDSRFSTSRPPYVHLPMTRSPSIHLSILPLQHSRSPPGGPCRIHKFCKNYKMFNCFLGRYTALESLEHCIKTKNDTSLKMSEVTSESLGQSKVLLNNWSTRGLCVELFVPTIVGIAVHRAPFTFTRTCHATKKDTSHIWLLS